MDKYINQESFRKKLLIGSEYLDEDTLMTVINILDCEPAEDVAPVRHGKWAVMHGVMTPGGDPLLYCPYCNDRDSEHMGGIEMPKNWNYCPVCGIKMDGDVNG